MTITFGLLFLKHEAGELPGPPIAHVHVKAYSKGGYKRVSGDAICIGAECVSASEMEVEINQLQAELESIRTEARRKYANYAASRRRT